MTHSVRIEQQLDVRESVSLVGLYLPHRELLRKAVEFMDYGIQCYGIQCGEAVFISERI